MSDFSHLPTDDDAERAKFWSTWTPATVVGLFLIAAILIGVLVLVLLGAWVD